MISKNVPVMNTIEFFVTFYVFNVFLKNLQGILHFKKCVIMAARAQKAKKNATSRIEPMPSMKLIDS